MQLMLRHHVEVFEANPLVREGLPERLDEADDWSSVYLRGMIYPIELMALLQVKRISRVLPVRQNTG